MIAHPFNALCDEECTILILGSFPSKASREGGFFYAHPRNRFWPLMAHLLGEALPASNTGKAEMLLRHHIALWDSLSACEVEGSLDSSVQRYTVNDFHQLFEKSPKIEKVLANGTLAYEAYRRNCLLEYGRPAYKLPSTSPANAAFSMQRLIGIWGEYIG